MNFVWEKLTYGSYTSAYPAVGDDWGPVSGIHVREWVDDEQGLQAEWMLVCLNYWTDGSATWASKGEAPNAVMAAKAAEQALVKLLSSDGEERATLMAECHVAIQKWQAELDQMDEEEEAE